MNGSLLHDAFGHHVWASLQVIDACRRLTPEQREATAVGTYGSIIETLRHLIGADASYLHVLTGGKVDEIDEASMDIDQLRTVMVGLGPAWSDLLDGDLDPNAEVVRHRDDGTDSSAPLSIRLGQAIHHGTDHRSQICTILTTLGVEPPSIDVWDYADKDGRLNVLTRSTPTG